MPTVANSIINVPIGRLSEHPDNARVHSPKQLRQIARSIRRFGFANPILVGETFVIIAGHGRYQAARELALETVPVIRLTGLSGAEQRALMLADNKLAENSRWDPDRLTKALRSLTDLEFNVEDIGFDMAEVDTMFGNVGDGSVVDGADAVEDPNRGRPAVSRPGDLYTLGCHRLFCGNAHDPRAYEALLGVDAAQAVISDLPYNVPTKGHISSGKRPRHPSFMEAAGELSSSEFIAFLSDAMKLMRQHSLNGSLHYLFMDWRHLFELLTAGREGYELKNLCVWAKDNGGMGSLYRSAHELIAVFKSGTAPHINNVELGRHGRNRLNVWHYPGANSMRRGRLADLDAHPTVKPVRMIADAILDCTTVGGTVLDPFVGSGTTILAAERTERRAVAIEIDPYYVDTAIRRLQERTGLVAIHATLEVTFNELAEQQEAGHGR